MLVVPEKAGRVDAALERHAPPEFRRPEIRKIPVHSVILSVLPPKRGSCQPNRRSTSRLSPPWTPFCRTSGSGRARWRATPASPASPILTLALGVGANAAIFSVVNAVLLRPLPWSDPDRAVMIWSRWTAFDKTWVSDGEVNGYRQESRTLADVGAWGDGPGQPDGRRRARARGRRLGDREPVLGARRVARSAAASSRPRKTCRTGRNVVIIGYGLWQRRYAGDPAIIGRVDPDQRRAVRGRRRHAGRLRAADRLPESRAEHVVDARAMEQRQHRSRQPRLLRRRAAEARRHGRAGARRSARRSRRRGPTRGLYPPQMQFDTLVLSLREEVVGTVRRAIWLLFGAVGFLLLIACANVANLLLARAEARQREMAVRTRARRRRRARHPPAHDRESRARRHQRRGRSRARHAGRPRARALEPVEHSPRRRRPRSTGASCSSRPSWRSSRRSIFSLAPAARLLRSDLTDSMKEGGGNATTGGGRRRFRNALVVAEMALAVVLLVGAGLMLRTLWSLQRDRSRLQSVRRADDADFAAGRRPTRTPAQVVDFYSRLIERIGAVPGVTRRGRGAIAAARIDDRRLRPLRGRLRAATRDERQRGLADRDRRLHGGDGRAGRAAAAASQRTDTTDSQLVGLINEEMARRYWAGRDPIGGRFRIGSRHDRPWVTVVGVVQGVRHNGITERRQGEVLHSRTRSGTGLLGNPTDPRDDAGDHAPTAIPSALDALRSAT